MSKAARKLRREALGMRRSVLPSAGTWLAPFLYTPWSPTFAQGFGFPLCQAQLCPLLKERPLWKDADRLPYRVNSDGT